MKKILESQEIFFGNKFLKF
jgi:hypothetical protein